MGSYAYTHTLQSSSTALQMADIEKSIQRGDMEATVATISVDVKNTGSMKGDEVTLVFVHPANAGQDGAPLKMLRGYRRTSLAAGEQQTLEFGVKVADLALVDSQGLRAT